MMLPLDFADYDQDYNDQNWHLPLEEFQQDAIEAINSLKNQIDIFTVESRYVDSELAAADAALSNQVAAHGDLLQNWIGTESFLSLVPLVPAYSDANTFLIEGADYSDLLGAGTRLIIDLGADGLVRNTVASSTYSAPDTTVNLDDANLTSNLEAVYCVKQRDGLTAYGSGKVMATTYGAGATTQAAIEAAIAAISGANRVLVLTPGTWSISADLEIPVNITLEMENGAVLDIASGQTVTINGCVDAGSYQIFSCTGTGAAKFSIGSVGVVNAAWFGIVGDGVTDNTAALQASINSAPDGGSWILPYDNNSYLTDSLLIPRKINMRGECGSSIQGGIPYKPKLQAKDSFVTSIFYNSGTGEFYGEIRYLCFDISLGADTAAAIDFQCGASRGIFERNDFLGSSTKNQYGLKFGDTTFYGPSYQNNLSQNTFQGLRYSIAYISDKGLVTAITVANEARGDIINHFANATRHITGQQSTAGIPDAATDLTSLKTLIAGLLTLYAAHNADVILASGWAYHNAQDTDHPLSSTAAPTTLDECITRLNDLKAKYNLHEAETTGHNGVGTVTADTIAGSIVGCQQNANKISLNDFGIWKTGVATCLRFEYAQDNLVQINNFQNGTGRRIEIIGSTANAETLNNIIMGNYFDGATAVDTVYYEVAAGNAAPAAVCLWNQSLDRDKVTDQNNPNRKVVFGPLSDSRLIHALSQMIYLKQYRAVNNDATSGRWPTFRGDSPSLAAEFLAGDWNDGAGVVAMGKDFTTHTAFNPGALCAIIRDLSGAGFYVYKTSNGSSFTRVAGFDYNGKLRIGNAVAGDVTGTAKSYKIEVFDANGNSRGYVQTYVGP